MHRSKGTKKDFVHTLLYIGKLCLEIILSSVVVIVKLKAHRFRG